VIFLGAMVGYALARSVSEAVFDADAAAAVQRLRGAVSKGHGPRSLLEELSRLWHQLACMQKVYQYADYIAINISSPNTPGLRELQHGEGLTSLLTQLKTKQAELHRQYQRYVPLAVKIAPDLEDDEIKDIADRIIASEIDAVIATNTTNSRPSSLVCSNLAAETGGLSGKPVFELSTQVLRQFVKELDGKIPVIAAGGISTANDALEKIKAGASLVQIYTGFIYSGPQLIHDCAKALKDN